jgi:pullulanase
MLISARITTINMIEVGLDDNQATPGSSDFTITPRIKVKRIEKQPGLVRLFTETLALDKSYTLEYKGEKKEIQPGDVLDDFYSQKELGCTWNEDRTIFRVFAPRATKVSMVLYDSLQQETGQEYDMLRDSDGIWECLLAGHYFGWLYNYKVEGPTADSEAFDPKALICDPYGRAVATRNEYLHRGRTLISDTRAFDWQGDRWLGIPLEDMLIYECHLRDLTAHPSSGATPGLAGSYKGAIHDGIRGGLAHIKSLGVNAVEFLPIQDFGNIEIPFNVAVNGLTNTWNPYSRNHWGYMTSYFFAPESYYASGNDLAADAWCGSNGKQVDEFKEVVRAFHKAGVAVIMDVVYNHVSQYDLNAFKLIDKKYYFRLDENGNYLAGSGCGNDFKTERPMAQRMIIDSILYWMQEYHIDGFRFDLAAMIDWDTIDKIAVAARKINPQAILIAEPWGGGKYNPAEFSQHDWAAWNDQFRNGIKGQNPENGTSFIFGRYWENNSKETLKRYLAGTLAKEGGLFQKSKHAVNYLGSHDDHTFGDFVRIGLGDVRPDQTVQDVLSNARLTPRQMRINKLGALILYVSQGGLMIEEGQEYGRSKVIVRSNAPDPQTGRIDHNSYNKDTETNWLNYGHADLNRELVEYYAGLAALRNRYALLRKAPRTAIQFLDHENPFALAMSIDRREAKEAVQILVLLNGHAEESATFTLPAGKWSVLVDEQKAGVVPLRESGDPSIVLGPSSGMVLVR